MIEPEDLDNVKKIAEVIERMGYTKPRISISDANEVDARIEITFRKSTFQAERDNA